MIKPVNTAEDYRALAPEEIMEITKGLNYSFEELENGYEFFDNNTRRTFRFPKTIKGLTKREALDFMTIRVAQNEVWNNNSL